MRGRCMILILFSVSSAAVADTVMVNGGWTYNGVLEFDNGKFSLNADGELQQFSAQDVGVVWFNSKERGSKRPPTSSVTIGTPIEKGPVATAGRATNTAAKPTTNTNDSSDGTKSCLLVFKNDQPKNKKSADVRKSVRGTLLSIRGDDVVVEEDVTDTTNSQKEQFKKKSFKKDGIDRLDCR
jgi:hypothetical protein